MYTFIYCQILTSEVVTVADHHKEHHQLNRLAFPRDLSCSICTLITVTKMTRPDRSMLVIVQARN